MLLLAGLRWVIVPHVKLEFSHFVYYGLKASIFVKIGFLRITGRNACWLNQQTKRIKVIKFYLLPMGTI